MTDVSLPPLDPLTMVSIRVPRGLLTRLDAVAGRTGRTRTDVARRLLDRALVEVDGARGRRLKPLYPWPK